MIVEYHRPATITEALNLLARVSPVTYAMGGGTVLNQGLEQPYAVVDLQNLELDRISTAGNNVRVGATSKLHALLEHDGLPPDIYTSIKLEATQNIRQMATIAGTLVVAKGRSPFATTLLALDASLEIQELDIEPIQVKLGDWFPLRARAKHSQLITLITFPLNIQLAYEYIARTPADQPIVCAAVAQWKSGRTRLALGGWGKAPIMAMDGPEAAGIETAAMDAFSHAEDEWASGEYRREMAGILARRALARVSAG